MDNNISKAFIWNTLGSGVYLGCLWLLNILVVRFGSYSEAGILSLAISIANVVQSVSLAGIRNYQVSDVKERYSNYTYICVRYITASIAFAGCIFFLLINAYSRYQVLCIIGMSVYRMIDALTDVYHGILQKKWRLDIVGKALAIRGVLIVSVFITILSIGKDLLLAIIGMTVVSFAEFIVFELRKPKSRFDYKESK
ncbi:MAG: lipopolysaccharide biosynthesis protein [Blautia sp.]